MSCYFLGMRLIPFALTGLLLITGCASTKPGSPTPQAANPAPAQKQALVLDVRTPAEFAAGHIEGALNVPLKELERRIPEIASDKDTPLMVHCQSGGRSAAATQILRRLGYTQVQDLGSLAHARQVVENKANSSPSQ